MSAIEFICVECGRQIVRFTAPDDAEPDLCGACLTIPGWFRDPVLREHIDPDHDGREAGAIAE